MLETRAGVLNSVHCTPFRCIPSAALFGCHYLLGCRVLYRELLIISEWQTRALRKFQFVIVQLKLQDRHRRTDRQVDSTSKESAEFWQRVNIVFWTQWVRPSRPLLGKTLYIFWVKPSLVILRLRYTVSCSRPNWVFYWRFVAYVRRVYHPPRHSVFVAFAVDSVQTLVYSYVVLCVYRV